MRISCEHDHRDFDIRYSNAEVYLDDVRQTACVWADEENGTVVRYKRGEDGALEQIDGVLQRETVHGIVRIVIEPRDQILHEDGRFVYKRLA